MKNRRTQDQVGAIEQAVLEFAADQAPVTLRQCFYHLSVMGLLAKTENEYKGLGKRMTAMREAGELPWELVVDETRFELAPVMYESPADALTALSQEYRRNPWTTQPVACEVWIEKQALAGVIESVTSEFGVGLFVNRGYGSSTYVHDAAVRFRDRFNTEGKVTNILYLGDHDASGVDMTRDLFDRWTRYCGKGDAPFQVARLALTQDQIDAWQLPTRPGKSTDPRAARFDGDTVELDAVPPNALRALVRAGIDAHLDHDAWDAARRAEHQHRGWLQRLAQRVAEAQ